MQCSQKLPEAFSFHTLVHWHKYSLINLHSIPQNDKLNTGFQMLNYWNPSLRTVLKVLWLQLHPPVFLGVMLLDLRLCWHSSLQILFSRIRLDRDHRWTDHQVSQPLLSCLGWTVLWISFLLFISLETKLLYPLPTARRIAGAQAVTVSFLVTSLTKIPLSRLFSLARSGKSPGCSERQNNGSHSADVLLVLCLSTILSLSSGGSSSDLMNSHQDAETSHGCSRETKDPSKFKCHSKRSDYLWVLGIYWWRKTFLTKKKGKKKLMNAQLNKMLQKLCQKSFWLHYVWFGNLNISSWLTSFKFETDVLIPALL